MNIAIGSDHGGRRLKDIIRDALIEQGHAVIDAGTHDDESCDYPDYAEVVCKNVLDSDEELGILVCGTGLGMSIAANKIPGIRAAQCGDEFTAEMARSHNNANILTLGERVIGAGLALNIAKVFINTPLVMFEELKKKISKKQ